MNSKWFGLISLLIDETTQRKNPFFISPLGWSSIFLETLQLVGWDGDSGGRGWKGVAVPCTSAGDGALRGFAGLWPQLHCSSHTKNRGGGGFEAPLHILLDLQTSTNLSRSQFFGCLSPVPPGMG